MNYADAIVYLKENNITKEDGTFYEFGEVCSTYRENDQGPVVRKPMNANPRLIAYEGVYFSTPKCCSTLIFGKNDTLEEVNLEKQK